MPLQGYPGEVVFKVVYRLSKGSNELTTVITATTDQATPGLWKEHLQVHITNVCV